MTPEETAAACAAAVSGLAAQFMLAGTTYHRGGELGFSGLDFYTAGRGGVLGPVDADVVAAAFCFFEPSFVRQQWELGLGVMAPAEASARFIETGHAWAREHLGDDVDWARLAALAGAVNAAANPAAAPLFAAWRTVPEPSGDDPHALALHRMHVSRELRNARHGAAVVAAGLAPAQAVAVRSPNMMALFGWTEEPAVDDDVRARWEAAEAATNRAMAPAYAPLSEAERAELVALCEAASAA